MKKVGLRLFACLGIVLSASIASAGLMIEPYVGYESGTTSATTKPVSIDVGGSTTAIDAGLRLGYKLPIMLWFAADYASVSGGKFNGSTDTYDMTGSDLFLDVGIDLPFLLRFWAGYGLANSRNISGTGLDQSVSGGTNMKAGIGFTLLPLVSINAEYLMLTPADYDSTVNGVKTSGSIDSAYKEFNSTAFLISVSLPLDL